MPCIPSGTRQGMRQHTLLATGVHGRKWMLGKLKKMDSTDDTLQGYANFLHLRATYVTTATSTHECMTEGEVN